MGASTLVHFGPRARPHGGAAVAALIVVALLAVGALVKPGDEAAPAAVAQELHVRVSEGPGYVRLHILLPDEVPPGSIEVQAVGRSILVLGQDEWGRPWRSRPIRVSQSVGPEGAQADFEADGSLTITLRASEEP